MKTLLAILFLSLLWATPSLAQTSLVVPFDQGAITWDAPVVDATHGLPTQHVVTCGSVVRTVPMPALTVLIRDVVPGPGHYTCSIYAENEFGRQAEPNVPVPEFAAGFRPRIVGGVKLEVR